MIRKICADDAEGFHRLRLHLDCEAEFLLIEKGERKSTVEDTRMSIEKTRISENEEIFVAEFEGEIVGYLSIKAGDYRRNRHSGYIVIAIMEKCTGMGIGKLLFEEMESWAFEKGLHRLELGVMAPNIRGKTLYEKKGFQVEGVKKDMFLVNGKYVDEIIMAKLI